MPKYEPLPFDTDSFMKNVDELAKEILPIFSNYPMYIAKGVLKEAASMLDDPPAKMTVEEFLKY